MLRSPYPHDVDTGSSRNIQVAIRFRPLSADEHSDSVPFALLAGTSVMDVEKQQTTNFDHVFDDRASTQMVYEFVCRDIVQACLKGINGTIFAYGQTSSGKTHTMFGPHGPAQCEIDESQGANVGIILQAIDEIFYQISEVITDRPFFICMNYFEVYNEKIIDLIAESEGKPSNLVALYEKDGETFLHNAMSPRISSPDDIFKIIRTCHSHRHVAATAMNENSSRSHTILRLKIESQYIRHAGTIESVAVGVLNFVDLAGSENAKKGKTLTVSDRFAETTKINKSLLALSQVIEKLVLKQQQRKTKEKENQSWHINWRDSILTRILRESLGGNSQTAVICCCSLNRANYAETTSTLHFASMTRCVTNHAKVNTTHDSDLKRLQGECQIMESQLEELQCQFMKLNEKTEELEDVKTERDTYKNEYERIEKELLELKSSMICKSQISPINVKSPFQGFPSCSTPNRRARRSIVPHLLPRLTVHHGELLDIAPKMSRERVLSSSQNVGLEIDALADPLDDHGMLQKRIHELQILLTSKESEMASLRESVEMADSQKVTMTTKLHDLEEKNNTVVTELAETSKKLDTWERKCCEMNEKASRLKQQNTELVHVATESRTRLQEQQEELRKLEEELRRLDWEADKSKEEVSSKDKEVTRLQEEINGLMQDNKKLHEDASRTSSTQAEIQHRSAQLEKELDASKEYNAELTRDAEQRITFLTQEVEELSARNRWLSEMHLDAQQDRCTSLVESQLEERIKECAELEGRIKRVEEQLSQSQCQVDALSLQHEISASEAESVAELQKRISFYEKDNSRIWEEREDYRESLEKRDVEVEGLQKRLEEAEGRIAHLLFEFETQANNEDPRVRDLTVSLKELRDQYRIKEDQCSALELALEEERNLHESEDLQQVPLDILTEARRNIRDETGQHPVLENHDVEDAALEQEEDATEAEVSTGTSKSQDNQREVILLEGQIGFLKLHIDKAEDENKQLKLKLKQLEEDEERVKDEAVQELRQKSEKVNRLSEDLRSSSTRLEEMIWKNKWLKERLLHQENWINATTKSCEVHLDTEYYCRRTLQNYKEEISLQNEENKAVDGILSSFEDIIIAQSEWIRFLSTETATLSDRLMDARKAEDELTSLRYELELELNKSLEKKGTMQRDYEETRQRLQLTEEQLTGSTNRLKEIHELVQYLQQADSRGSSTVERSQESTSHGRVQTAEKATGASLAEIAAEMNLGESVEELPAECPPMPGEVYSLRRFNQRWKARNAELQEEMRNLYPLKNQIRCQAGDVAQLKAQVNSLTSTVAEQDKLIDQGQRQIVALTTEKENVERQVESSQQIINNLQQSIDIKQDELANLVQMKTEDKLREFSSEDLVNKMASMDAFNRTLKDELHKTENELQRTQKELQQLQGRSRMWSTLAVERPKISAEEQPRTRSRGLPKSKPDDMPQEKEKRKSTNRAPRKPIVTKETGSDNPTRPLQGSAVLDDGQVNSAENSECLQM